MKITFFQYIPKFMALEENLWNVEAILSMYTEAIRQSSIVVFPEYFLSWSLYIHSLQEYVQIWNDVCVLDRLLQITQRYSEQTFVFWSVIFPEQSGKYYNTSLIVKNGRILGKYHKKALIYNEKYICDSDDMSCIFEVDGVSCGVSICWDVILPEIYRKYTGKIDLMIVPAFWGIGGNALQAQYPFSLEKKYYTEIGVTRAYENAFALLFVNAVGVYTSPFYSDRMMGGSFFVEPPLGVTYKTNNKKSDFCHSIEVSFRDLKKYQEFYATDTDYLFYKEKWYI